MSKACCRHQRSELKSQLRLSEVKIKKIVTNISIFVSAQNFFYHLKNSDILNFFLSQFSHFEIKVFSLIFTFGDFIQRKSVKFFKIIFNNFNYIFSFKFLYFLLRRTFSFSIYKNLSIHFFLLQTLNVEIFVNTFSWFSNSYIKFSLLM